jgi:hypothetical protein
MRRIAFLIPLLVAACSVRLPAPEPSLAPPPPVRPDVAPPAPSATQPFTTAEQEAARTPAPAPKAAPAAKAPPASAPKTAAAAPKTAAVAPKPATAPAAPPLDLRSLEQRLKDSAAIGVLTKLSLKNQVDDLVAQFREYHAGRRPPTLAELRRPFELLLMKVLSLLQDKDSALARDVDASREAIWGVLSDRDKLAQFT